MDSLTCAPVQISGSPSAQGGPSTWNGPTSDVSALRPREKILHFVRHAEGVHNLDRSSLKTMAAHDARLTPTGMKQCEALQSVARELRPELIVSSPLTRTLHTASLSFAPQCASGTPIVALEELRETVNYLCDARRPLSEIRAEYPDVDFSACPHDEDFFWRTFEQHYGSQDVYQGLRETSDLSALACRARAALAWLGARPEREIVVVSHSAFLMNLFGFGQPSSGRRNLRGLPPCVQYADHQVALWMMSSFANAEMRTVVAHFPDTGSAH
jgi:broad specificity phosphatase PhoE